MNPNRTHEDEEMEPDYTGDNYPDTVGASSSHPEVLLSRVFFFGFALLRIFRSERGIE
jgi:hypothetical protein